MTAGTHQAKPDFFERLIDKALGTDAGIAPRLRSLFEPAPQTALGWLEEPEHDTATAAHRLEEVPAPTAQPRMMEPDRGSAHDISARPERSTVFVDAPTDGDLPEPAMPRAALPLVVLDAGGPVDSAQAHAVAPAPLAPDRAPVLAPIAPVRRREASAQVEPAPPRLVPDSRVTIERVFATPSRAAHRRQSDDRHAGPSPSPAAPSVNITIGRVEVRAVSAPAAKPRAEARGLKPLGLDEYLKRRGAR
jgi:hypothetical protein